MLNLLYTKGLTTEQIGEISETIYGRTYSKQQVSYLSNSCREDVDQWINRSLSSHYLAVYIDATFIATRKDKQVSKEAYYTILGGIGRWKLKGVKCCQSPQRRGYMLEGRG